MPTPKQRRLMMGGVGIPPYYVDATGGNDTNHGRSPYAAWKTIAKVNASTFLPGDRILFKRGETWREQLIVPSSGISGRPIIFDTYGAGIRPILNGSDLVTGWDVHDVNIYQHIGYIQGADSMHGVFQDGVRLIKAANHAAIVQGSFYLDDAADILYAWCTDDADPDTHVMEATRSGLYEFDANGKAWLQINNLNITKSGKSGVNLRNKNCRNISCNNNLVNWNNFRGFDLGGTDIIDQGKYAIVISNNIIHDCLSEGIHLSLGSYCIAENNEIYNGKKDATATKGYANVDSPGIIMGSGADHNICRRNYLHVDGYDVDRPLLMVENEAGEVRPINCLVEGNKLITQGNFALQTEGDGTQIINNLCVNATTVIGLVATNDGSINEVYYHNTFVQTTGIYNFYAYTSTNLTFKNNIVRSPVGDAVRIDDSAKLGFIASNNCYKVAAGGAWRWGSTGAYVTLPNWQVACGQDANSLDADPVFVTNYTNLHLQITSPCIAAGDPTVGVLTDYDGVVRGAAVDIGAYEYV